MPRISTPCLRVCVMDPDAGLCAGCGRTRDEIARWGAMAEEERLAIMAGLEARLQAASLAPAETVAER